VAQTHQKRIPITFKIDPFRKHCLLNGHDDIGLTLEKVDRIKSYEDRRLKETPWLLNKHPQ
jgi:3-isopropylmalate dehydratase small subunit